MNSEYIDYPFTSHGINFISRVMNNSPMASQIKSLPLSYFQKLNENAVNELIGNPSLMTKVEILESLAHINEGGTHAFILLGANA